MKTLASRLKLARENKKLTQKQLAKMAGVTQSAIGNLESGLRFTSRKIAVIADILGVDVLWLAEGKGSAPVKAKENYPLVRVSPEELKLITAYNEATELGRQILMHAAESVPRKLNELSHQS